MAGPRAAGGPAAAARLHRRRAGRRQDLHDARRTRTRCRREGIDVVVGLVDTHGRPETDAQIGDLEVIPRRRIEHRGVVLDEMDVDAIIARQPQLCIVDELAHTNAPGSRHEKRYEDVLEILDAGIGVLTAVNIQHLETLNDAVGRVTGVRVRETVPDTFLDRADEVVNVDITVDELQTRIRQGKVYAPEKVEQALSNFFREGNLSTLRELALRAIADEVGEKAASSRQREGLEPGADPGARDGVYELESRAPRVSSAPARESPDGSARRWYAVYVETPRESPARITDRRSRRPCEEHRARREPRRDGGPRESRPSGRRTHRVRQPRRHHARHFRPDRAIALGDPAARVGAQSLPAGDQGRLGAGRAAYGCARAHRPGHRRNVNDARPHNFEVGRRELKLDSRRRAFNRRR